MKEWPISQISISKNNLVISVIRIYLELGIWFLEFWLFQLFIIFHIKPHGEEQWLQTWDGKEGSEKGTGRSHGSDEESEDQKIASKGYANGGQNKAHEVEENQRIKSRITYFSLSLQKKSFRSNADRVKTTL